MAATAIDRLVLADVPSSVWDDFHAGRAAAAEPELVSCWTRAQSLGAPLEGAPPEDRLLRGEALRLHAGHVELIQAIGDSILDRATAQVADHDFLLLLADPDGVVVQTRGGGEFSETAARVRLIAGANWSEAARGTNAIGTAAAANRPTEVHGHAHFGRSYHDLVCYAAPVRGVDGLPLAILDATSRVDRADPAIARTIVQTARSLEELVRLQAYASAGVSITRVLGRSLDRMSDPALLVEAPGTIVRANAAARTILGAELAGHDPGASLGLDWHALVAEALAPVTGGHPLVLGRGTNRRAWRLRAEPLAAPNGTIVAVFVVLEPGRLIAPASPRTTAPRDPFDAIFTTDGAVTQAIRWARQLASSDLPIMLLAETGAGKELFAHAIHAASPRAAGPWHAINCGALAPSLLEAELFGYAPGAFTGAERTGKPGLFHAASGGTLFLDEVAEMSSAMQAALLRVVETGTFRRVGDTRLERTDVRIVCATCRDLRALVAARGFRQDLYYRLKGATVTIPPLRERSDVVALAEHLLGPATALSPEASDAIARWTWPGNVRELKSMLAVAQVAAAGARWIELAHLPPELTTAASPTTALDDVERDALVRALAECGGNVSRAARKLGVARSTVHRMKRRFGLA
ncbi:MAG TPA: sigma-54-dependent Fis family transcriptional regulator [Kofleriaceae bacterium]|nr:sigma-54-dependent Fis family transcriptional regulator [Kofleriaceae bacterium]